jgi:hypothetical protein
MAQGEAESVREDGGELKIIGKWLFAAGWTGRGEEGTWVFQVHPK